MAPLQFPELIGIGTQRSGSTWMWTNLIGHPDLFVPPYKEINYLSLRGQVPHEKTLQVRRQKLAEVLAAHSRGVIGDPWVAEWFARFARSERNDDAWYASLYQGAPQGSIGVDFSPAYCTMDDAQVRRVKTLIPNARVIFVMRDPIDRAWSQLCLLNSLGRSPGIASAQEFQRWCQSSSSARYHAYPAILARWRAVFGPDRVFVAHYEELKSGPLALLERLCGWLGSDFNPDWFVDSVSSTYNKRAKTPISTEFARAAAPVMLPHLAPLAAQEGGPPVQWLERCIGLLRASP